MVGGRRYPRRREGGVTTAGAAASCKQAPTEESEARKEEPGGSEKEAEGRRRQNTKSKAQSRQKSAQENMKHASRRPKHNKPIQVMGKVPKDPTRQAQGPATACQESNRSGAHCSAAPPHVFPLPAPTCAAARTEMHSPSCSRSSHWLILPPSGKDGCCPAPYT